MKFILIIIVLALSITACKENSRKLPYYDTSDFTPKWEMKDPSTFHAIRKFSLTDQEGNNFTEKKLDGKITVADFFFTSCPGICPRMAVSMADLQKEFSNDSQVLLISHSVTPVKDSVPVLKEYAMEKKVNYKKWKLLTGNVGDIYNLGRKYYFVEEDLGEQSDSTVFLHTENFVLIDKNRHIRGIYNSLYNNIIESLKNDIKELKKE